MLLLALYPETLFDLIFCIFSLRPAQQYDLIASRGILVVLFGASPFFAISLSQEERR